VRDTASILGLIGGILGLVLSALAVMAGIAVHFVPRLFPPNVNLPFPIDRYFPIFGAFMIGRGSIALASAIVGIVAAVIVNRANRTGGILLLIFGIIGIVSLLIVFLIPGVLLIIGGVLALSERQERKDNHFGFEKKSPSSPVELPPQEPKE